jgi:hypothetical protein
MSIPSFLLCTFVVFKKMYELPYPCHEDVCESTGIAPLFLRRVYKIANSDLVSCPSVRMEQLDSYWMDFDEI